MKTQRQMLSKVLLEDLYLCNPVVSDFSGFISVAELSHNHSKTRSNRTSSPSSSSTNSIMKTLCLSVGMLLLITCCCNARPQGVQFNTGPVTCCDQFSNIRVPAKKIVDITKTHSFCMNQGFIVETVKGQLICFRSSTRWVEEAYNRMINSEGINLQQ
ncbi:PREDICTED: C-C motif chemokine 4-like isoform X2 [Poecilia mexicana]|uniref:C-C motif chemokine 4-like isoform X2 n=1 Tax=Poecilia mexicana TaxID=48701 RepID=UPI00072DE89D|nr:PREDICTED: C-C motif chemokine 4-like isoform X2 [Poecilia mexicana]